MGFNCGIVGLPNVGKSTLFNALTATIAAQAANYPFCTIEPNSGRVAVPDPRLDTIARLGKSAQIVPTFLEFVDIAGLVRGASKGEGLGNQFLGNIRSVDAIIHVLRCFESTDIIHVEGSIDPIRDAETVDTELMIADMDSLERRVHAAEKKMRGNDAEAKLQLQVMKPVLEALRAGKTARSVKVADELMIADMDSLERRVHAAEKKMRGNDAEAKLQLQVMKPVLEALRAGKTARSVKVADELMPTFKQLQLLTAKPVLYVCNVDEASAATGNSLTARVAERAKAEGAVSVVISAAIEAEVAQLTEPEERAAFLESLGLEETGLARVIRAGYGLLDLITYFTVGPKEARAWTVHKGATAPEAAGVIHTDFQRGFIAAEVTAYDDFVACGGEQGAKTAGKMRLEGRDYIVQDGDVMLFRFNV